MFQLDKVLTDGLKVALNQIMLVLNAQFRQIVSFIRVSVNLKHEIAKGTLGKGRWSHVSFEYMAQEMEIRQRCGTTNIHCEALGVASWTMELPLHLHFSAFDVIMRL